jgi:putative phosphoribosyl transferase
MLRKFRDRTDAGKQLAARLTRYAKCRNGIVLALPRGGVPVAFEVARALHFPLDIFLVRKLGVPWFEELAFGAIASGGIRVLNEDIVKALQLDNSIIDEVAAQAQHELTRRELAYRGDRPALQLRGRIVILVDDGVATGATMCAAVRAVREQLPAGIVVAVPIAPPDACDTLRAEVEDLVCLMTPGNFGAISVCYKDFSQTTDADVRELLERAESAETTKVAN